MPTIVTRGAMSAKAFGAFRTYLGNAVNFLELRNLPNYYINSLAVDSSNNIYVTGRNAGSYVTVEKIDSTGVSTSFAKQYNSGSIANCCYTYSSSGTCVDVDSSGNVYVGGTAGGGNGGCRSYGYVEAYDSSGTLLWQKYIDSNSGDASTVCGIKYNPITGWVYVVTQFDAGAFGFCALNASSGALQYNRRMAQTAVGYPSFNGTFYTASNNMAIDSSGNVYVCISVATAVQGDTVGYLKIDSNFNIQQVKVVTGLISAANFAQCIALDSSGNVYIGTSGIGTYGYATIIKFDSSGNYLWNAYARQSFTSLGFQAITTDSSGNVYAAGGYVAGSLYGGSSFIFKYDSSGTIQYQRGINTSYGPIRGLNMGPSNSMYFSGPWDGSNGIIGNVPTDGSKTGTYTVGSTSVTYSASSYITGTATLTQPTITRTFSGSATFGTPSYTGASFSTTVSRAVI